MMNAKSHIGTLRYLHAYYVYDLVYLCHSSLEQQIELVLKSLSILAFNVDKLLILKPKYKSWNFHPYTTSHQIKISKFERQS